MPRLYFNLLQYLYTRRRSKFPREESETIFFLSFRALEEEREVKLISHKL